MSITRKNFLEHLFNSFPFLSGEDTAKMLQLLIQLTKKHEEELDNIYWGQVQPQTFSEPQNEFTRSFCSFFCQVPPELKPYFINDVLKLIDTYTKLLDRW